MKSTRIHLLRHGQVQGFEEKRYNGQGNVALTAQGEQQSFALAERLRTYPLAAVYSSDLSRCLFAAQKIAVSHQLEVQVVPALRELNIGHWEGLTWQQLERDYPELWQARLADIVHVAPPAGESLLQLAQRIRPAFRQIVAAHGGEEVAVVAHGGVNRVLLLDAIGAPLASLFSIEQSYACHNIIDYYGDEVSVVHKLNG